ncbi:MAG: zinc-binding dehydrogenase [Acidimicrobiia bacterium]|nr:zinc-binding dehydrogenase [Acidimicrobiia bacterium]MYG72394.1 zinc-binding dehydrogenase [Acidimicrobiia bacterium]
MEALVFERKPVRYVAAAAASRVVPGAGGGVGPLRLRDIDPPELPGPDWHTIRPRLTGICGSDLATVEGRSSRYFEPLVSFPFVPGHEVVGVDDNGRRLALEPVLGPAARDEPLPFPGAAPGDGEDYGYLLGGSIKNGIQIGFCSSTGGGWGEALVAHQSQLHPVPDNFTDEAAVMLEPAAGGVHAALKARIQPGDSVAVLGAGTMGLCSLAALRSLTEAGTVIATAKYPHQQDLATALGADIVVDPREVRRAVRRFCGCRMLGDYLSGGVDITIDAVGNPGSVADAIAITRPRGRVVLLGMPESARIDLTGLWHRETEMVGAYTYGTETLHGGRTATSFEMAFDLVASANLEQLVSARYPLNRYREAIAHAAEAGSRGAIKVVFEQDV